MSLGIVIAHKSIPLPTVLETLWEAESERAKKLPKAGKPQEAGIITPKDGLCFRVIYSSGNVLEALMKGHLLEDWCNIIENCDSKEDFSPLLYRLVATRLHSGWQLVAVFNAKLKTTVVRLGGEGHRVLISPLEKIPSAWQELESYEKSSSEKTYAYLLTPGLAEWQVKVTKLSGTAEETLRVYGVYPEEWEKHLEGCVSDRALMWGGVSNIKRRLKSDCYFC